MKRITLTEWASANWSPPPRLATLRRWVKFGNILPAPEKVGRQYYVRADAQYWKPGWAIPVFPEECTLSIHDVRGPLSIKEIRNLPQESDAGGVYFLFNFDELQYVGISKDMANRIGQHRSQLRIAFGESRCLEVDTHELRERLEAEYITLYRPKENRRGNPGRSRRAA